MRIVIAGQTYYPASNGQAVFTVHLAEGLASIGHQVMAIVPSDRRQAFASELNRVQVHCVTAMPLSRNFPDVYLNLPAGRQVGRLLSAFRPDMIHIQDHYPLCRTVVSVARRRGLPVIGTNHFLPENILHYLKMPAWTRKFLERMAWWTMLNLYNRLDVATTPTETAAGILRQQSIRPPVFPISCGVDLERFNPQVRVDRVQMRQAYGLDPEAMLFLFVGRVDQEKRLDVLLHALSLLDRDDIQLAIAGRGRYMSELQAMASQLGLGRRAVFTGFVPPADLPGLLNSADVFAMPSEAELQSIATLEAMACGRPVLAARARALPELVADGVNGYLFDPGSPKHAALCMAQLAAERKRWMAMGAASINRVSVHSLANTLRRYEELYFELLPVPTRFRTVRPVQRAASVSSKSL